MNKVNHSVNVFLYTVGQNDFFLVETESTFPPGTEIADTQCIGITIENNNIAEPLQSFLLSLASMNALVRIVPERTNHSVTIFDNDRKYTTSSKFHSH